MKTFDSWLGKLTAVILLGAVFAAVRAAQAATIVGPYTADANTLHLWHMDSSVVPVPDVAVGGTNLAKLYNGAGLGTSSYPGFGTAVSTLDGGQNGVAAANTDAHITPSSAASPGNVLMTLADPTTGAFTMEAVLWIGFDPAKNFGLAGVGGNGRNAPCQILSGESNSNPNRIFQFRLAPLQSANANTTVRLEFNNVNLGGTAQLLSFNIPTTGPDAIVSNNWYHVAVAYNGSENTVDNMKFYWTLLDGTRTNANLIASTNNARDLPVAATVFGVGNIPGRTANANFLGYIDEVRISSVARGSNQMMFSGPAPLVATQPADQTVALGQPAGFSVKVLGLDPLFYQWRLDGTNVDGATTNVYSIAAAQLTNAGPYDVVITNNYGAITSSVATLTVGTPVTVTAEPVDLVVAVGQSAGFSVTVAGATPLFYQWRQSGTNVAGATQSAYSIAAAQLTNAGPYDVVATNNFGSVTSAVATLTVRVPLNLTWLGLGGPDWDTNLVSWVTDTAVNVAYTTGDNVTFDVNGSAVPSVNLTGPFSPSSVLVNAASDYTFSSSTNGGIVGSSRLTKDGAGTLILDTANSYNGPTVIQGGILQLGTGAARGSLGKGPITNNTAIVINRTGTTSFTNTLTGAGSLTNILGGTISISGTNNTLSGPIVMNAGTLSLAGPQAPGNSTNFILNAAVNGTLGTVLTVSGGVTLSSSVTLSMLGTSDSPDARCTLSTATGGLTNAVNGPIVVGGSGSVQFLTGVNTELNINGSISATDFTGKLVLRGTGVGHIYGTINLPSANHISTTDAGTWVLHSTGNSWTNSNLALGIFRLAANNALPSGVILQLGGTLDLAGFNQQIGGLVDGPGVETITNSSTTLDCTLTVNSAQPSLFSGVIKDAALGGGPGKLGLTITGGGTLTLAGASVYAGDTTISAGTLALSGAGTLNSTNGNVIIAAGATFDVSAVTSSPYHLRTHKTLIGGEAAGGATINGALFLNGGSFLTLTYVSGTPAINVTGGQLTFNANATTVTVSGSALGVGSYKLISASAGGSVAGTLPASVTVGGSGVTAGLNASLRITSDELWLDVAAASPPLITSMSYDGANFILSGTNGIEGSTYYVLASTNVAAPLATWEPVFTNQFEVNGVFSVTNPILPGVPVRFYLLQVP